MKNYLDILDGTPSANELSKLYICVPVKLGCRQMLDEQATTAKVSTIKIVDLYDKFSFHLPSCSFLKNQTSFCTKGFLEISKFTC